MHPLVKMILEQLPESGVPDNLVALAEHVRQCDERDRVGAELFVMARRFHAAGFDVAAGTLIALAAS